MTTALAHLPATGRSRGILRHSPWDVLLVALSLAHLAVLLAAPHWAVIAVGLWWNSNTIAHNFIHKPFFRPRWMNVAFSLYQSLLLGVPQTVWRARHLAHHADVRVHLRPSRLMAAEVALVVGLWTFLITNVPQVFIHHYLPGYVLGLVLCYLQGHYEHAAGGTVSHYGRVYNFLFFNDGYHVEHHANAAVHWRELSGHARRAAATQSRYPAVLRWMDGSLRTSTRLSPVHRLLHALERATLASPRLQRFVLRRHEQALCEVLAGAGGIHRIGIVGGGLFPRTALVMQRRFPDAQITVVDASAGNIALAREFVAGIEFRNEWFDGMRHAGFDLLIFPLSYVGDRSGLYRRPPAPRVIVHDWVWRRRGRGAVVSWALLKRVNLVEVGSPGASA